MRYNYQIEVQHDGLNRYRIVKGSNKYEAQATANALLRLWDEQWKRKCFADKLKSDRAIQQRERERTKFEHEENIAEANRLTYEAERVDQSLNTILLSTLSMKPITWNHFWDSSPFIDMQPEIPIERPLLALPKLENEKYNQKLSLFQKLSRTKKFEATRASNQSYQSDYNRIRRENDVIVESNNVNRHNYENNMTAWAARRDEFYQLQRAYNAEIRAWEQAYHSGDSDAISKFHEKLLSSVCDFFSFQRQVEASFQDDARLLLVDTYLPTIDDLPSLKKVTYVRSSGEFKETNKTVAFMNQQYENVIYQIVLQSLYLVFMHDQKTNFIDSIILNGKVNTIDKATGSRIDPYILSVSVKKSDFEKLNLETIDPKAWFKSSKGVSASKIAIVTPVAPIAMIDREDSRFIKGYNVMHTIDNSMNLAAMDWQDFENLIRELFAEEFNINGGEVKITQASRDGGVDAVAFDPSPIRGGKIVIQAKRYTNVVGVSAVRDLYGTVLNEGAMKGILITTSNYGNDAYKFAQGKPLTLLNGANLLSMLEKHGHRARIDLKEAKEFQKSEKYSYGW